MTKPQYVRVLGLVLLSAIVLGAMWEFWLEDLVMGALDSDCKQIACRWGKVPCDHVAAEWLGQHVV